MNPGCMTNVLRRAGAALKSDLELGETLFFPHPLAWLMVLGLAIIGAIWLWLSPVDLDIASFGDFPFVLSSLIFIGFLLARLGLTRLVAVTFGLAFFLFAIPVGRVLNYLGMSMGLPLMDESLANIDAMLGFDWKAYALWVDSHPAVAQVFTWAYRTYMSLFLFAFAWAVIFGSLRRLREFLLLFSITGMITVLLCGLFPAYGATWHFGLTGDKVQNLPSWAGLYALQDAMAIHDGHMHELVFGKLTGITTFPSFHTVMALLFAWFWRGTVLHWPMWGMAILVIAATPAVGGHYLIDLLAGTLLFFLVAWFLRRVGMDAPPASVPWRMPARASVPGPAAGPSS